MKCVPLKTRLLCPPQDNLLEALDDVLPALQEGDILLITSKVVSIWEGHCISVDHVPDRDVLIENEADRSLPREVVPNKKAILTLKHNTLIPSAGIDESNSDGHYILLPKDPVLSAQKIWDYYRQKYGIDQFGVIITDSTSHALRYGVVSVSLGFYGFVPLRDYRGQKDLFGREFSISQTNIPDSLSAVAGLLMGEGTESTPAVLVRGIQGVQFTDKETYNQFIIPEKEDLYYPLLSVFYDKK